MYWFIHSCSIIPIYYIINNDIKLGDIASIAESTAIVAILYTFYYQINRYTNK